MAETDRELLDRIRDYLNANDRFCATNDIQLVKLEPGYAEAVLTVTPDKLNGVGVVQGGATFSLADFAFAGAANSGNIPTVAATSSFNFLCPGTGGRLRAVAREISRGKRTVLCTIEVFDERDRLIAYGTTTGFVTGEKLLD